MWKFVGMRARGGACVRVTAATLELFRNKKMDIIVNEYKNKEGAREERQEYGLALGFSTEARWQLVFCSESPYNKKIGNILKTNNTKKVLCK